jgi:hypothetical protein
MPNSVPAKLPVWRTTKETLRYTWTHSGTFLRFAWPLLMISLPISAAMNWTDYPHNQKLFAFPLQFLWLAIGSMLAVQWHRFILLNEHPQSSVNLKLASVGLRYTAVIFALIVLYAVSGGLLLLGLTKLHGGPVATFNVVHWMAATTTLVLMLLCIFRLSLILPGLAILDKSARVKSSWEATHGNGWRIMLGALMAALPAMLLATSIKLAAGGPLGLSRIGYTATNIFTDFINMTAGMTSVTFLSLAYRHFFGPVVEATPPVSAT